MYAVHHICGRWIFSLQFPPQNGSNFRLVQRALPSTFHHFLLPQPPPRYIHQQAEAQHAHGTEMAHCGTQKQTETDLGDHPRNFCPTQTNPSNHDRSTAHPNVILAEILASLRAYCWSRVSLNKVLLNSISEGVAIFHVQKTNHPKSCRNFSQNPKDLYLSWV